MMEPEDKFLYGYLALILGVSAYITGFIVHQSHEGRKVLEKAPSAKIIKIDGDYSYININETPEPEIKAASPRTGITREDFQEVPGKVLADKYRQVYLYRGSWKVQE